ncbi:MAG: alkyl sulfatase dimerization domain-containing protein [Thermodesulfobacteriota bacterium]
MARTERWWRLGWAAIALICLLLAGCGQDKPPAKGQSAATPELLAAQCRDAVGQPRVERISQHVWAALGFDLANVVLIQTPQGNVIVDTAMSPARAQEIKKALEAKAGPGPVIAVIYTHSHIDHVGGAAVFAAPGVPIWASAALPEHLLKQYSLFLPIESVRGSRQFGRRVGLADLPCSSIGRRPDLKAAAQSGMLLPTHTFRGRQTLDFGGFKLELVEAHGETHDQLLVWVPADKTIVAGDNFYWTFPNLYTIRGTSPRPISEWIASLDRMRRLAPEHLIPTHTKPLHGAAAINAALTNYRDAIQWVRDQVVRGANQGRDLDTLAENIKLPPHLAELPYLKELYGQIDWSVRAIYTNNLGWFDGRADRLYPLPKAQAASREVQLMGGPAKVMDLARQALAKGDTRWAVHLLAKLADSGLMQDQAAALRDLQAQAYQGLAATVFNTNGRAYLLETVQELRQGLVQPAKAHMDPRMVQQVPLEAIFRVLPSKLKLNQAMDVHESLVFVFPDVKERFVVTLRRGVVEVVQGEPLPGTPPPVGVVTIQARDYRRMIFGLEGPLALYAKGKVSVQGSWLKVLAFLRRFETKG